MDMQGVGGSRSKRYRSLCERDDASVAKSKRSKVQVEQAIEKMLQDMKQPDYYEKQGKQNQAGNLRLEVPPTPRRWLGDKHQDSFNHLQAQANAYMRQCRFDMAAFLQLQMLEIRNQHFGHDHPYTIESKHSLACTYAKLCWLEEAEELELEVLSYWRRTFGQEHPKTLQATQVLAVIRNPYRSAAT
ncbi:hypothetical protein FRC08_006268 [Ceratobasidium sp. 394]|nr:hypothetical protein FRC08_006268 [Ceratobasidium sp. 394]